MDKREDLSGPICRKLMELKENGPVPFHMPGHKRKNAGPFPDAQACDITEITGCDDLHDPRGMIRESMEMVRETYGSRASWYLVNGSTAGILASLSAVCRPGDRILASRNCHKAVYNAIRLLRLKPVYLWPARDPDSGIAGSIDPEDVGTRFVSYPDIRAVILTSPTYEGIVSDVRGIRHAMDENGGREVPLIVDEAHGAHFHFHRYFPESAVTRGADLVVQSSHKTLPAMTQTALLHLCSDRVSSGIIQDRLSIFQTSSPSYILMASAEYSVLYMRKHPEAVEKYVKQLARFRERCLGLGVVLLLENDHGRFFRMDPGKLVFYAEGRGKDLFHRLRMDYGIEAEMAMRSHLICMTSVMDEPEDYERLWEALSSIDAIYKREDMRESVWGGSGADSADGWKTGLDKEEREAAESGKVCPGQRHKGDGGVPVPECVLYAWECQDRSAESLPISHAAGRIAARDIMVYPPGIPIIVAGERFEKEIVENIRYFLYNEYHVVGVESDSGQEPRLLCLRD